MKKSDLVGCVIAYIALVVITYLCIFGWSEQTQKENRQIAQQAKTYISHADQVLIDLTKNGDER